MTNNPMAKLNIKAENENGTIKSVSGNKFIKITLTRGNKIISKIDFNLIGSGFWGQFPVIKQQGKKQQGDNNQLPQDEIGLMIN